MAQRSTSSSKTLVFPSYLDVLPRFGTRRNLNNPTYGEREGRVARLLGKPYMPYQQYIADVLGEVDPKTGLRVYREGLITLPRQQGKTTMIIVKKAHRALDCSEPQVILFAAQDGIEAKKKWLQHAELIKKTPLAARLMSADEPTTSNGKENLEWSNGSSERPLSSRPSSGHGDTLDLGVVTEAFSQTDYRYEDTMQPAMLARPDAQYLAESTAGTATSLYWNERIEAERARMLAEPLRPYRVALFDWSADPEQDDISDPVTWRKVLPALGHTMNFAEVEHAFVTANTPAKLRTFKRGVLNITDLEEAGAGIFEDDDWAATGDDNSVLIGTRAFALDITPDRTWSAISWAGLNRGGAPHHELIKHARGTHWVIAYLAEKLRRNGTDKLFVIAGAQAALMEDDLRKAGIDVQLLSKAEYAAACARYHDGIVDHTSRHLASGQEPLDLAVAGAAWSTGEARIFDRKDSTTDISPLVSAAVAQEGHLRVLEDDYDIADSVG